MNILMKSLRNVTAIAVVGCSLFVAQAAELSDTSLDPSANITNLVAKISEKLSLTTEQKASVEPILQESFAKRRAVAEKYRGERNLRSLRSLRRELEPIQKETDAKLKAVLTEAQMKEYQKLRAETKEELRDKIRERRKKAK
jgi:hypothetical protein